mmetsp:Transcript_101360/g.285916  ORF Transcript_101360/g.285916 Transcript_101360/m.285916 type:complete len:291 (+) Transcript_101360:215-1087(+)
MQRHLAGPFGAYQALVPGEVCVQIGEAPTHNVAVWPRFRASFRALQSLAVENPGHLRRPRNVLVGDLTRRPVPVEERALAAMPPREQLEEYYAGIIDVPGFIPAQFRCPQRINADVGQQGPVPTQEHVAGLDVAVCDDGPGAMQIREPSEHVPSVAHPYASTRVAAALEKLLQGAFPHERHDQTKRAVARHGQQTNDVRVATPGEIGDSPSEVLQRDRRSVGRRLQYLDRNLLSAREAWHVSPVHVGGAADPLHSDPWEIAMRDLTVARRRRSLCKFSAAPLSQMPPGDK